MKANRSANTGPELALRRALHAAGFRYRLGRRIQLATRGVRPDLVFPRNRVAVFVDGCFWHGCPQHGRRPSDPTGYWRAKLDRNRERDLAVDRELSQAGWHVVRLWEHEPIPIAVANVREALAMRGGDQLPHATRPVPVRRDTSGIK